MLLQVDNLSHSYGDKVLYDSISFTLDEGEKVGIIARNGTGKSTLLETLVGRNKADAGTVDIVGSTTISYLPQEPELDDNATVLDNVLQAKSDDIAVLKNYLTATAANDVDRITEYAAAMEQFNLWQLEGEVHQILGKLELDEPSKLAGHLSGGQRKRLALARVLLQDADLTVWDEPTNHLDINMITWLQEYVARQKFGLLLVTHDRYFLDATCNSILELEGGKLRRYKGNYKQYLEKKTELETALEAEHKSDLKKWKKELEWLRRQPKARGTKAQARVDAAGDLKTKVQDGRKENTDLRLDRLGSLRLGSKVLELHNVSKSISSKELFHDFTYKFIKGDRIGVVGANGSGKSTLLNVLTKSITTDTGKVIHGETLNIGYFQQVVPPSRENLRVIEAVTDVAEYFQTTGEKPMDARNLLTFFGFSYKQQHQFVDKLSGGERRRLYLLQVLIAQPNFLILDEPTNDLDLPTLRALEEFLQYYQGCLLVVSHDRYFLDAVTDQTFALEGDGLVKQFPGSYSLYRTALDEASTAVKGKKEVESVPQLSAAQKQNKPSYKQIQELKELEEQLQKVEEDKQSALLRLERAGEDYAQVAVAAEELKQLTEQLEEVEGRWLLLQEELEKFESFGH